MKFLTIALVFLAIVMSCKKRGKNLSSLQSLSLPTEEAGSEQAYTKWVRQRLYENKQYNGQSDLKGAEGIEYSGDQYSIRVPRGQMTEQNARDMIVSLQNKPSGIYGPVTGNMLGWPDQKDGQTITPGQKVGLKPNLPGVSTAPVVMTEGANGDPFSFGVHTGDFRGSPAEKENGSTHPENGIREWAFKNDPETGDLLFINRGFYVKQTDPLGATLGQTIAGTIKNLPGGNMVDAGAQGSMGMAQSVIWESQQKDIMKHMKESYGAQGRADNKTFDINQQLPNGNRLSEERAEDWDVRMRNSLKMKSGKPFKDDIPLQRPAAAATKTEPTKQSTGQSQPSTQANQPVAPATKTQPAVQ